MISGVFITVTVCGVRAVFLVFFLKIFPLLVVCTCLVYLSVGRERHAQLSKFERNFGLLESFEVSLCRLTACQKLVFILNYN